MGQIPVFNPDARKNDGNFLEAMSVTAMCISSHYKGVNGSSLQDFVGNLCRELCPIEEAAEAWRGFKVVPNIMSFCPGVRWSTFKVPYMFPPMHANMETPPWLAKLGRFGVLHRPRDDEKVDILVINDGRDVLKISGEGKNYKNNIGKETLEGILKKIPVESQVHFIFCNDVSDGSFEKSKDFFMNGYIFQDITLLVVKLELDKKTVRLQLLNAHTRGQGKTLADRKIAIIVPLKRLK